VIAWWRARKERKRLEEEALEAVSPTCACGHRRNEHFGSHVQGVAGLVLGVGPCGVFRCNCMYFARLRKAS